jgi:hypothetical protein
MSAANTNILIKRSLSTPVPSSLQSGELAYSYASNTIFIGTPDGTGVVNVGGQYYTSTIDAATDAATASTLVKRDATGNASFNFITANIIGTIYGTANAATHLANAQNFSISGGDITASSVLFDGTNNVTLNASLNDVGGLTAGSVGSATSIPVISYGANGRILTVSSADINTAVTISDGTHSNTVNNGSTLTFSANNNLSTYVNPTGESVTITADLTKFIVANTAGTYQTVDGVLNISGDLNVTGNITYTDVETIVSQNSLIKLANNNTISDAVDIGFFGQYFDGADERNTGLFRHAGSGKDYYLFDGYTGDPESTFTINPADPSFRLTTLNANITAPTANISTANITSANVSTDIAVVGNAYVGTLTLANGTQFTDDGSANVYIHTLQSSTQFSNIAYYDPATGELAYGSIAELAPYELSRGGYTWMIDTNGNFTAPTGSQFLASQGTGATGGYSFTLDGGLDTGMFSPSDGELAFYSNGDEVISANTSAVQIYQPLTLSTALSVDNGGTGQTSFTTGLMLVGNGTGALQTVANSSYSTTGTLATDQTITSVTVDDYGRLTNLTASAIAISAGAVSGLATVATSGLATDLNLSGFTLGVSNGGTGQTSLTQNGIVYGDGTNPAGVTAAAGTSDLTGSRQLLTVNASGIPSWTSVLDGGNF